jgi:hypothetical protein
MKVGDKLYCCNDFMSAGKKIFRVGETYSILDVNVHLDDLGNFDRIFLTNDNVQWYWFVINSNDEDETANAYYYGKYFVDLRKDRYKKLMKINESRR